MKKAIKALWHCIKAFFMAVVEGAAILFGMNDNSKYGRVLRRIVATGFTVVVVFWAARGVVYFIDEVDWDDFDLFIGDDDYYLSEKLSDDVFFFDCYYDNNGYVANANGKKLIKEVNWVSRPQGDDSLVCYCNGEKRGYFHMRDGKVVVKPAFNHAWVFSEGLAAVEQAGKVVFIDTTGKVVIDRGFAYDEVVDGYVFHQGHCAVNDRTGKCMGLIDRNGDWVIAPQYEKIVPIDTFWFVGSEDKEAVVTFGMDTVIPMTQASFSIKDSIILATFNDHTMGSYSLQGKLITASQIRSVNLLTYDAHELFYSKQSEEEEAEEDSYGAVPTFRRDVATCMRYEADSGWYGLMAPDGRLITPPSYVNIEAISEDLYLCETTCGRGVVINSKGKRVE